MNTIKLEGFEEAFAALCEKKEKAVVLFSSTQDQEGKHWCPDCEQILPYYPDFIKDCEQHKIPLYLFIAGDRPTWKDPKHLFRTKPELQLTGIPTMGLFDGKKVVRKLEGMEIADKGQRALLFE